MNSLLRISVFGNTLALILSLWPGINLIPGQPCEAAPFQQEQKQEPELKVGITRAVLGNGKLAKEVTSAVREIVEEKKTITIRSKNLGIKGKRGSVRRELRINYTVNGRPGVLELKNGVRVNIYKAIVKHARKESEARQKAMEESNQKKDREVSKDPPKTNDGKTTDKLSPFKKPLSTVCSLMVQRQDGGRYHGISVDVIVQVTEGHRGSADFVRRNIGQDMKTSLQEAERAVQVRYSDWGKHDVKISFEDKYAAKDGGSAGAAFALLLLSTLEGFEIDPWFAVTGDIVVNSKITKVGAIEAKLRQGAIDNRTIVAIPEENANAMNDLMVLYPVETIWNTQVISVPDLESLVAVARIDRGADLQKAIDLFSTIQESLVTGGTSELEKAEVRKTLTQIMELAPGHQSARSLLRIAEHGLPKRLSRNASLRELAFITHSLNDALWTGATMNSRTITLSMLKSIQGELRDLEKLSHEDIEPVIESNADYVAAVIRYANNPTRGSAAALDRTRTALLEAFRVVSADRALMEKLLNE